MNEEPTTQKDLEEFRPIEESTRALGRAVTMVLPFVGLLLVIVPFSIFAPNFLSLENFKTVVLQTVIVAIAATGMTFVIISGGIDLSVGSIIALTTVAIAVTLKPYGEAPPVFLGLLAGLGMAALAGFLNGAMITTLRIVPFVATLGMLGIARGVAKWISRESVVYPTPTWINDIMARRPKEEWLKLEPQWFQNLPEGTREPVEQIIFSPGIWILLVIVLVMWLLLTYTTFGRYTTAIGSNEPTARLCGVRVNWVKIGIYTLAGFLAGVGGVIQYSRLGGGDPTIAVGLELDVIAAVVIGGGSLSGGQGSIVGTLIGALAMSFLRNGCSLLEWGNYVQEIFIGIFIVLFVAIDQIRRARTAT